MSEREIFKNKLQKLKDQGLKDLHFYPGNLESSSLEDFYAEANRLLECVDRGEGRPLRFNDSRKK